MNTQENDRAATISRLSADARYLASEELNGRRPGTRGHELAARYLERRLSELDLEPTFPDGYGQRVPNHEGTTGLNLCGELPGRSDRRILIGAHYDHFEGILGADDNAAAVAIALEVARRLRPWRGNSSVVFCFFDQEEPEFFCNYDMGSVHFAEHPPFDLEAIDCAIIMDLCGHDLPSELCPHGVVVMGAENQAYLTDTVRAADGDELALIAVPHDPRLPPQFLDQSDHYAFRKHGVPFLFLSCGRWEHYHSRTDTFDKLNVDKMARLAESLEQMVRLLDDTPDERKQRDVAPTDFLEFAASGAQRISGIQVPAEEKALLQFAVEWASRTMAV